MTPSARWSNASASCRIEWRPSRLLACALCLLGVLGALSALASEMPGALAWPVAAAALAWALSLARAEVVRPARVLTWPATGAPLLDGVPLQTVRLRWRGPLAFLHWRSEDGRTGRLAWWPDTLDPAARRELRLAAERHAVSRRAAGMRG